MIAGTNIMPVTDREYTVTANDAGTILQFGDVSDRRAGGFVFHIIPDAPFIAAGNQLSIVAKVRAGRAPLTGNPPTGFGLQTDLLAEPFIPAQFHARVLNGVTTDITVLQPVQTPITAVSYLVVPSFGEFIGVQVGPILTGTATIIGAAFWGPCTP